MTQKSTPYLTNRSLNFTLSLSFPLFPLEDVIMNWEMVKMGGRKTGCGWFPNTVSSSTFTAIIILSLSKCKFFILYMCYTYSIYTILCLICTYMSRIYVPYMYIYNIHESALCVYVLCVLIYFYTCIYCVVVKYE